MGRYKMRQGVRNVRIGIGKGYRQRIKRRKGLVEKIMNHIDRAAEQPKNKGKESFFDAMKSKFSHIFGTRNK